MIRQDPCSIEKNPRESLYTASLGELCFSYHERRPSLHRVIDPCCTILQDQQRNLYPQTSWENCLADFGDDLRGRRSVCSKANARGEREHGHSHCWGACERVMPKQISATCVCHSHCPRPENKATRPVAVDRNEALGLCRIC